MDVMEKILQHNLVKKEIAKQGYQLVALKEFKEDNEKIYAKAQAIFEGSIVKVDVEIVKGDIEYV